MVGKILCLYQVLNDQIKIKLLYLFWEEWEVVRILALMLPVQIDFTAWIVTFLLWQFPIRAIYSSRCWSLKGDQMLLIEKRIIKDLQSHLNKWAFKQVWIQKIMVCPVIAFLSQVAYLAIFIYDFMPIHKPSKEHDKQLYFCFICSLKSHSGLSVNCWHHVMWVLWTPLKAIHGHIEHCSVLI